METIIAVSSVVGVNILVQILKNKILPKFGANGVHAFIFLVAFLFIVAKTIFEGHPEWHHAVEVGLNMLIASVAVYEIVLKKVIKFLNIPTVL